MIGATALGSAVPWDLAPHLPWKVFTSPVDKWALQPSFVVGEYLFIALAIVALIHARRAGKGHLLIWVAALIAGTANDMIFMALPLVDNFWQAQATIMLTPRLPLYIPCVYVCFMYYPTVAVRRLGLPPLSQAALTGLTACLFYYPYDITGAKFLWWTWHDTDLPIAKRILGAPTSSSLWTLTFVGVFAWLVDRALRKDEVVTGKTFARGLAMVAGLTTLLMMLQMAPLQQLDGGAPGYIAFAVGLLLYLGVSARGRKAAQPEAPRPEDGLLHKAVLVYFAALFSIMLMFDPATHRSPGVHQLPGECYVEAKDITGLTRHEFLCVSDFDEDYDFSCSEPPADGVEWYTVCGRAHTNKTAWVGGVGLLGVLGGLWFSWLLGPLRRRAKAEVHP